MSYLPKNPNTKFNVNYLDGTSQTGNNGIGDWIAYADAAQSTPVNGTGGSPSVTITRNLVDPLRGPASLLLSKGASNLQGNGISLDFKVSRADYGKPLQIAFTYIVASGTFTSGDASDVRVFIYDIENDVVIQPAPYTLQGGSLVPNEYKATFQTAVSSGDYHNYRLIMHVATTSTSAYTLRFSDVSVGPQIVNYGAPITDWISYTPTGSWVTNTTYIGKYRRVGSHAEFQLELNLTGAPTSAGLTINLPGGLSIDSSVLSAAAATTYPVLPSSTGIASDTGTANYQLQVLYNSTSSVACYVLDQSTTYINNNAAVTQTIPFTWGNTDKLYIYFSVPIVGWSSNVLMSNDTDTRVVAARYTTASGFNITTTPTIINYGTKVNDTHGAVTTGSSWKYVAPVSGYYRASAQYSNASAELKIYYLSLYKNDVLYSETSATRQATNSAPERPFFSDIIYLNAGDYIDFRAYTNSLTSTAEANSTYNFVSIERLSGPSAIAATETVAASYSAPGGVVIGNGATVIRDFSNKIFDTHNAVTTGASWKFTAPVRGYYEVTARGSIGIASATVGNAYNLNLNKNGSAFITLGTTVFQTSFAYGNFPTQGTYVILLNAGDYIDVRDNQTSGVSATTQTGDYILIRRIGN